MSDDGATKPAAPAVYGEHAAFSWAVRRLTEGQTVERQRDLLLDALYAVCATTGEEGVGALLLCAATVDEVGAGEAGR